MECAKLIIQSGIKRVVYGEEYRIMDGVKLRRAGIEVNCCYRRITLIKRKKE